MIRLRTLGPIGLTDEAGAELSGLLRQPKRFALLAYLALARPRGYQRREVLMALFWPELDEGRARAALRQALYFLRKRVPEPVIENRGDEEVACARDGLWCDAVAFEAAMEDGEPEAALALYRGDLLDGFYVPDASPRFGYWLDEERERLRGMAVDGAWQASRRAEASGDDDAARRYAARVVSLAPLDEAGIRGQMELLDRLNDRAAALTAFEPWAERFRAELEVEPSSETLALVEALRATDPRPEAEAEAGAGAGSTVGTRAGVGRNGGTAARSTTRSGAGGAAAPQLDRRKPEPVPSSRGGRGRWWGTVVVLVVALVGGLLLARPWATVAGGEGGTRGAGGSDGSRVMVLPFVYQGGPEDAYLSEGLLYLFAVALEGAELRSVAPHVVLQAVQTPVIRSHDPERAAELAAGASADRYVIGNAVESDGQLHLSVALHETATGEVSGQAAAGGPTSELFNLVDQVAAELLTAYRGESSRVTRVAALTTRSLQAFKAFLRGEARLREGRFDAAIAAFEEAVLLDEGFALAYYRLSLASSWAFRSELSTRAAEQAVRHADRLPDHERMLLAAHQAYRRGDAAEARARFTELTQLYPDDPENWYKLGEVIVHFGAPYGWPMEDARDPLLRAAELRSLEAEVFYHLAQIEAVGGDAAAALDAVDRSLRAAPDGARVPQLNVLRALLGAEGAEWEDALAMLEAADDFTLISAIYNAAVYAGHPRQALDIGRLAVAEGRGADTRFFGHLFSATMHAARGRWRAVVAEAEAMRRVDPRRADIALVLLGSSPGVRVPASELDALAARLRSDEPRRLAGLRTDRWSHSAAYGPITEVYAQGMAAVAVGAEGRARGIATRLRGEGRDSSVASVLAAGLEGMIADRSGATGDGAPPAVPRVPAEDLILSPILSQPAARFWHAVSLERAGRPRDAIHWYATLDRFSIHELPWAVEGLRRRARLHELLGEPEAAEDLHARYREWRAGDARIVTPAAPGPA